MFLLVLLKQAHIDIKGSYARKDKHNALKWDNYKVINSDIFDILNRSFKNNFDPNSYVNSTSILHIIKKKKYQILRLLNWQRISEP